MGKGCRVSLGHDVNALILAVVRVARIREYTKKH